MAFNDYVAAWLASAVYYGQDEETFNKQVPHGWQKKHCAEDAESGFVCMLFTKVGCLSRDQDAVGSVKTRLPGVLTF